MTRHSVRWLHVVYVKKDSGKSLWLWTMEQNTWGVPIVQTVISVCWRICHRVREQCSWRCPTRLRGKMLRSVNTKNLALWDCHIKRRILAGLTSPVKSIGPAPFFAGQIWNWLSIVRLHPQGMGEKKKNHHWLCEHSYFQWLTTWTEAGNETLICCLFESISPYIVR